MEWNRGSRTWIAAAALAALGLTAGCPGSGSGSKSAEAPNAPKGQASYEGELRMTPAALAVFVEVEISDKVREGAGWMKLHDPVANEEVRLRLDMVHRDPMAETAPGRYYVCADFVNDRGYKYDVDFLLKKTETGLETTDVLIHRVDEKPRYDWVQDPVKGYWVRQPA